eukprot:6210437-Pleurochrysis_carterae.AAC.1
MHRSAQRDTKLVGSYGSYGTGEQNLACAQAILVGSTPLPPKTKLRARRDPLAAPPCRHV